MLDIITHCIDNRVSTSYDGVCVCVRVCGGGGEGEGKGGS